MQNKPQTDVPIYVGSTYQEKSSGTQFVIINLSHPHDKLGEPPLIIFQHKEGQAPDHDRSHYLPIAEFKERFSYIPNPR